MCSLLLCQKIIGSIRLEEKLTPFSWKNDCEIICRKRGIHLKCFPLWTNITGKHTVNAVDI